MNERIRELAEQAGMTRILDEHAHEYGNGMFENTPYPELEKFAELIVRECFQACMNEGASYEEKAAGAYQSNLYVTAIKQHFGVEE
jgi:hypothetical protein